MARERNRRRPMSEINVVPYIDVMLVLLVIFMVTAPLLMQGVKVELPEAVSPDRLVDVAEHLGRDVELGQPAQRVDDLVAREAMLGVGVEVQ